MPTKTRFKTASCPLGKWEATVKSEDIEQIREFLNRDNSLRTVGELTALSQKYLGHGQAGSCPPCNSKLMKELETLVNNADSNT